ncbi:cytochrome P450 [Salipiger pallidus]|uniref:Cytochrome P450 n=1 Tax=Salipiger pallidus TaxID=1775170 RepID=A0A8J3EHM1_9RHOB|nr:cytochrome P450 [Salipiger pallidus]GGG79798.1 cytochrome P450 [Salipiger pallidus]
MLDQLPPRIEPATEPLGMLASLKAARQNVLRIIPGIAYTQPIVTGSTGGARWHMVQGPEGMKRIFLDNVVNYPKSEVMLRMLRPAVGDSLFTSEGSQWRWQRRAIAPVFAARNVEALAPMMTATAERACERLSRGASAEMVAEMLSATFDVICDVALSGREHFDADAYGDAITKYFLTVGRASLLDFLEVPHWVPRPAELFGRGAVKTMHSMVSKAIEARRREATGGADDLLDHMLAAKDPESGRTMSPQDLLHNMQFFIVAGHETTALSLAWALYLLAHDQPAQARARDEARSVLQGGPCGHGELDRMPGITAILDETMRLYPPVGMLARNVRQPDTMYDREIRPRETIFVNTWALHRHDAYWDRPDEFDPTRFTGPQERDRYLHLPFGAGPRVCVGANFAMMQAGIILATLLSRYRFAPKGPKPTPIMHMTVRPDPGVELTVTPL